MPDRIIGMIDPTWFGFVTALVGSAGVAGMGMAETPAGYFTAMGLLLVFVMILVPTAFRMMYKMSRDARAEAEKRDKTFTDTLLALEKSRDEASANLFASIRKDHREDNMTLANRLHELGGKIDGLGCKGRGNS